MQLSTKQKMYASVLGLCGVALAVDRVVLGPAELTAAEGEAELLATSTSGTAGRTAMAATAAADPGMLWAIARQVDEVAKTENVDIEQIPDAFRAPDSWFPPPATETQPVSVGPDPVEQFLAAHRLQAVMAGGASSVAVIDGTGLKVGETLDGFTLVSVGDRSAVFESESGVRVELELTEDDD
ncbi:MAG: hypothetical protein ACYTJ0_05120 [Planctomycetota bacterium]|jgi:hypothetical protein